MSGPTVNQALRARFESIRRTEIERLNKKLRGLTDDERRSVEAITADVVHAIVRLPERGLTSDASASALEAMIRLFALDVAQPFRAANAGVPQGCPPSRCSRFGASTVAR